MSDGMSNPARYFGQQVRRWGWHPGDGGKAIFAILAKEADA